MSEGLPREEARGKGFSRVAPAIFERVVDDLKSARQLVGAERLALPTHKATVAGADDHVRSAIIEAFRAGGLKPPDAASVEATVKAPRAVVEKVTTLLLREKVLVKLDTIVFHTDALRVLKEEIAALKGSASGGRATVDVAAFKDRYGVSRKFAIPLLEYLDRERVTRRTGDVRLVYLGAVLLFVGVFLHRALEILDAGADALTQFGKAIRAENEDHDRQNDEHFRQPDGTKQGKHECSLQPRPSTATVARL